MSQWGIHGALQEELTENFPDWWALVHNNKYSSNHFSKLEEMASYHDFRCVFSI